MRISDWSSDVCSSDLPAFGTDRATAVGVGCAHVIPPEAKRRSRDRGLALLVLEGAEKLLDRTGSRRRRRVRLVAVVVAHPLHLVLHVSLIAAFRPEVEHEIGRASCRERVWQYVSLSVVGGS